MMEHDTELQAMKARSPDAAMHKCEYCHEPKPDVVYRPDPFYQDIHGDDTPHWLCDSCYHESAMDI